MEVSPSHQPVCAFHGKRLTRRPMRTDKQLFVKHRNQRIDISIKELLGESSQRKMFLQVIWSVFVPSRAGKEEGAGIDFYVSGLRTSRNRGAHMYRCSQPAPRTLSESIGSFGDSASVFPSAAASSASLSINGRAAHSFLHAGVSFRDFFLPPSLCRFVQIRREKKYIIIKERLFFFIIILFFHIAHLLRGRRHTRRLLRIRVCVCVYRYVLVIGCLLRPASPSRAREKRGPPPKRSCSSHENVCDRDL